jgi:hypothetical protein
VRHPGAPDGLAVTTGPLIGRALVRRRMRRSQRPTKLAKGEYIPFWARYRFKVAQRQWNEKLREARNAQAKLLRWNSL